MQLEAIQAFVGGVVASLVATFLYAFIAKQRPRPGKLAVVFIVFASLATLLFMSVGNRGDNEAIPTAQPTESPTVSTFATLTVGMGDSGTAFEDLTLTVFQQLNCDQVKPPKITFQAAASGQEPLVFATPVVQGEYKTYGDYVIQFVDTRLTLAGCKVDFRVKKNGE